MKCKHCGVKVVQMNYGGWCHEDEKGLLYEECSKAEPERTVEEMEAHIAALEAALRKSDNITYLPNNPPQRPTTYGRREVIDRGPKKG